MARDVDDEGIDEPFEIEGVDLGDEPAADEDELEALEEKYSKQMRQIMPQKIELPISTLPDMIKNQINLNPDFQRRGRWDVARKSRFIESLIMNVPIPPVFLGEDDYGRYVVLDGRQRLTAIHDFFRNVYRLKGLKVWKELNKMAWDQMQAEKLDRFLLRRFIPAVVILRESSPQVKYDVFDRLNTGGVIANRMEIRNAVLQGGFTNLIRELSKDSTFRHLWGIPMKQVQLAKSQIYNKMGDLELVLRFFALSEYESMTMTYRDFLSDFMEMRNTRYKGDAGLESTDRRRFNQAVTNNWRIFRDDAFRKPPDKTGERKAARSAPIADALMVALADIDPATITPVRAERIKRAMRVLLAKDEDFVDAVSRGTNGKGAIERRITKARSAVHGALGK